MKLLSALLLAALLPALPVMAQGQPLPAALADACDRQKP
jgi:hypothetical protein